jgi:uncharacterized membrane protein YphA (DoxX/SURF4 family)
MPYALWTAQVALAAVFLFAGSMKFVMSAEDMGDMFPLAFMRFIGACEVLGGLGLILPGILHIRRGLTPLAAAGLVIIMAGAIPSAAIDAGAVAAIVPLAIGLVAAFIVRNRWSWFTQA